MSNEHGNDDLFREVDQALQTAAKAIDTEGFMFLYVKLAGTVVAIRNYLMMSGVPEAMTDQMVMMVWRKWFRIPYDDYVGEDEYTVDDDGD